MFKVGDSYLKEYGNKGRKAKYSMYKCEDCGESKEHRCDYAKNMTVCRKCLSKTQMTTHGGSKEKLFKVWVSMRKRCNLVTHNRYKDYGGRGITICQTWDNNYEIFKKWAISSGYEEGLSIDRIDNDKGYYDGNCKWSTPKEQANNRRSTKLF